MRRVVSFLFLLTLALGCATAQSTRPASIRPPDIEAGLVSPLNFGSGDTAPATIEVRIANRGTVPIIAHRIEIEAPGMHQYTLARAVRDFHQTIQPGETKAFSVFTTATALTTRNISEPLMLRVLVVFAAGESSWREVIMMR